MVQRFLAAGLMALVRQIPAILALSRPQKRGLVVSSDAFICVVSVLLAFSLRLGTLYVFTKSTALVCAVALAFWLVIFFWRRTYRAIFRYSGASTIISLAMSCLTMMLPMVMAFTIVGIPGVPRTVAIIQPLVFFLLLALSRMVARYLLVDLVQQRTEGETQRRVIIYGAGRAGRQLASSMQLEPDFALLGYIDDDIALDGQRLNNVPVSHSSRLAAMIEAVAATDVFMALPTVSNRRRRQIVETLEPLHVCVQTLPAIRDLVNGKISVNLLRKIDIEDLLGRDSVHPNDELLARTITRKTVMVTGAGGSIGSELCRQIIKHKPVRLILVEIGEFALFSIEQELVRLAAAEAIDLRIEGDLVNVSDRGQIKRAIEKWRPDTIFHAAAYKHVPIVEKNVLAGARNNILGTYYTALAALGSGVSHFILISTDKAVRPTNIMGATKRVCELALQALDDRGSSTVFSMVRFGNVLGSSGSVVPTFQRQISEGGPVTVTDHRITRYFMTIPEAAQLVIQAGGMATGGEVYVLDMGTVVRISELARTMINLSGMSVRDEANPDGDIEIIEVGLRPGEKLYEELLIGQDPLATEHVRIMRAREHFIPLAELERSLTRLEGALDAADEDTVRSLIGELVPEYAANGEGAVAEAVAVVR